MQANPLLAPLDFAYVNRVKIRLLCQLFLTEPRSTARRSNGFSQNLQLSQARHSRLKKQGGSGANTPNMGLFLCLHSLCDTSE
jgi:hypothetical protein